MEIYLIRHTTPDIAKEICYGQSDIGLVGSFPEESQRILQELPASVDKVFTSPLKRCVQLAQLISGSGLEQIWQLQEMDFGDWELKPWSDIPRAELDPWMADFVNHQVPKGESMRLLADRVIAWYSKIKSSKLEKIAIVTHAGPIRIILSEVNQTPFEEAFERYPVSYGEVIRIG